KTVFTLLYALTLYFCLTLPQHFPFCPGEGYRKDCGRQRGYRDGFPVRRKDDARSHREADDSPDQGGRCIPRYSKRAFAATLCGVLVAERTEPRVFVCQRSRLRPTAPVDPGQWCTPERSGR